MDQEQRDFPPIESRTMGEPDQITILEKRIRELEAQLKEKYTILERDRESAGTYPSTEDHYKTLYEFAPVGIFSTRSDGRVLYANPTLARILGFGSAEEAVHGFSDIGKELYVDPERRSEFLRLVREHGIVEGFEYEARTIDGRHIWISMNARISENHADGQFVIEGFSTDITERKKTEQALLLSEQRFSQSFRNAPYIQTISRIHDSRFIEVNDAFVSVTGYQREEALASSALGLNLWIDENDRAAVLQDLQTGKSVSTGEFLFRKKNGEHLIGMFSAQILRLHEEEYLLSTMKDITEEKRAELALRELTINFSTAFRNSPVALSIISLDTDRFVDVNEVFLRETGYGWEEVIGSTSEELGLFVQPDARDRLIAEVKSKGNAHNLELEIRTKPGDILTCIMSTAIIQIGGKSHSLSTILDITDRKLAEEARIRDAQRFRALIENAPDGIALIDHDQRFVFASPAARRMFGYSETDPLNLDPAKLTHPDDLPMVLTALYGLLQDPTLVPTIQYRFQAKNGEWRWVETTFTNLLKEPSVNAIVMNFRDITDRKMAETALIESEMRWKNILIDTPQIGVALDPDARIRFVNSHLLRITGWKEDEILGRNWFDVFIPEDVRDRVQHVFRTVMQSRDTHGFSTFENEIVTRNGEIRNVSWSNLLTIDTQGEVVDVTCLGVDLTERKRSEEQLRESESQLRAVFEQAAVGVARLSRDGAWIEVNRRLCDIVGYTEQEIMTLRHHDITYPSDLDRNLNAIRQLLAGEVSAYTLELRFLKKNGSLVWVTLSVSLVRESDGTPKYFICVIEDISSRKQAEELLSSLNAELEHRVQERTTELEASNRELESFSYSVSHDLRAPLRAIEGWSAIVMEDCSDQVNEDGLRYLARIRSETHRMSSLIDGLLQLSRLARVELSRTKVDLSKLGADLVGRLQELYQDRQVEIRIQPGIHAWGDGRLLEILLFNLLENAWKFTKLRPLARVEFGWMEQEDRVVYFVRDNGVGFDMKYAEKLFGVFQRLHGSSEYPGTGIGLATVHRIVLRHQGQVWAESKEDEGTTVFFTLHEDDRR